MPSKNVFISHAEKNNMLADCLVDLMETGIGISTTDVFCSSLESMKIPSGVNFIGFIKEQILNPKLVILLLTPDYLKSQFCLCELGATWALSNKIIPLLVRPTTYSDMKAVLTGIQGLKIDDSNDLNQMQEEIITTLAVSGKPFSRWEVKRDEFLSKISTQLPVPSTGDISRGEYDKVVKNYEDAKDELTKAYTIIKEKEFLLEKISSLKDKEQVSEAVAAFTGLDDEFTRLTEDASAFLSDLPRVVRNAFYLDCIGRLSWSEFDREDQKQIQRAIDNDFLVDNDPYLSLNESDPKVERARKALGDLEKFIDEKADEAFYDRYKEHHDHILKFKSKRFWDTIL